jgi:uncharacterized membrane protein YdbT with pleckstrin-like domain
MNQPSTKPHQKIRFFLYLILVANIISYYIITFFKLSNNTNLFLEIYLTITLCVLIIASIKSIIDWKTIRIYLLIAIMFISIAYFR